MTRRNFLQQFILTLLTLVFGPEVVARLTEGQLELAERWAQKQVQLRLRFYAQLRCSTPADTGVRIVL